VDGNHRRAVRAQEVIESAGFTAESQSTQRTRRG
jgi:hypothetical protein